MDMGQALLLALIAAAGVVVGLLGARIHPAGPAARSVLVGGAVGVLVLVLWLTLTRAYQPLDSALDQVRDGSDGPGPAIELGVILLAGLLIGFFAPVVLARGVSEPGPRELASSGRRIGSLDTRARAEAPPLRTDTSPARLGMVLAAGIGLRNVAVGLALGASAAEGELDLTWVLVLSLLVYSVLEGAGVVAPLLTGDARPGAVGLAVMTALAVAPMPAATAIGVAWTNDDLRVAFLAAAAGAVLFALMRLLPLEVARPGRPSAFAAGLALGMALMFVATMLVTVSGAGA